MSKQIGLFSKAIDSLDHCDGCRAPVAHVAAAPCPIAGRWVALCRVCAALRGFVWVDREERKAAHR